MQENSRLQQGRKIAAAPTSAISSANPIFISAKEHSALHNWLLMAPAAAAAPLLLLLLLGPAACWASSCFCSSKHSESQVSKLVDI